jgi:hypothetical protein
MGKPHYERANYSVVGEEQGTASEDVEVGDLPGCDLLLYASCTSFRAVLRIFCQNCASSSRLAIGLNCIQIVRYCRLDTQAVARLKPQGTGLVGNGSRRLATRTLPLISGAPACATLRSRYRDLRGRRSGLSKP